MRLEKGGKPPISNTEPQTVTFDYLHRRIEKQSCSMRPHFAVLDKEQSFQYFGTLQCLNTEREREAAESPPLGPGLIELIKDRSRPLSVLICGDTTRDTLLTLQ